MRISTTLLVTFMGLMSLDALAVEPKDLKDVDIGAMTQETQVMANAEGIHLVWWIPPEYWEASLLGDKDMSEADRKAFLAIMKQYSMLAVAQADLSRFGTVSFYDRDTITRGMSIEFSDGKTKKAIKPVERVPDELGLLLKVMTPMLESALGNTGKNLQFYVLDDQDKDGRVISPYLASTLTVLLKEKDGKAVEPVVIELPVNSLFVPRTCPNGKPAHVSWVVCPWDGTKLPK
jgi:hypothetical protein